MTSGRADGQQLVDQVVPPEADRGQTLGPGVEVRPGLVAGVGQRILKGVAKHLIKQFFTSLRREVTAPPPAQS